MFPTATVEAFDALLIATSAQPLWLHRSDRHALADNVCNLLVLDPALADPTHPPLVAEEKALELYRRSLLFTALTRTVYWRPSDDHVDDERREAHTKLIPRARARLETQTRPLVELARQEFAGNRRIPHPFVCLQVLRALRMVEKEPWLEADSEREPEQIGIDAGEAVTTVWAGLEPVCENLVARHALGLADAADAVALAFCAASAAQVGSSAGRHADAAAQACLASSAHGAGWLGGRVAAREPTVSGSGRRLTIPGSEVFAALGEVLLAASDVDHLGREEGEHGLTCRPQLREAVEHGLRLADDAYVESPNEATSGWAAEQVFGEHLVEAWATASVLRLALAATGVADHETRQLVLERYGAKPSSGSEWPSFLDWDKYIAESEPEEKVGVLRFIDDHVVRDRLVEPGRSAGTTSVVLLFGPPGTTKTTIARAVANGLKWPLISLSPGNFLDRGLESLERRATVVFDDLQSLSRTVVIFDECDELFRTREPSKVSDAERGAAAFMTASMLPKLQDLHDRGRIVVFICTNFLDSIDPAIKRVGRVDHIVAVSPPDTPQRRTTIEDALKLNRSPNKDKKHLSAAIAVLAQGSEDYVRGEVIAAARELGKIEKFASKKKAEEVAEAVLQRQKDAVTLRQTENGTLYDNFKRQRKDISEPHRSPQGKGP